MSLDDVDPATRVTLERFGFDPETFESLRQRVIAGVPTVIEGVVEPPGEKDLVPLPEPASAGYDEARATGIDALRAGRIGVVVLAGGMATRFGGVVKGIVPVVDGRSFLELKLSDTARLADGLGTAIPVAVMTSFATDDETRAHVAGLDVPEPLWFSQFVSLRLTPGGELFREADGRPSLYGPGHGDLFEALQRSGTLDALRAKGVEHVVVSNVDNLGARVDPVVVGAHLAQGRPVTTEVVPKEGDTGGAPVRVDGRLQLLEGPRFPPGFDQDAVRVFNTNTAILSVETLAEAHPLTWMTAEKQIDGRTAVQLERVFHEVTAFVPTTFLEVPRRGPRGRFFPIKTPEDLERSEPELRELLAS